MKNKLFPILAVFVLSFCISRGEVIEGACTLYYSKKGAVDHVIEFGDVVKAKCQFRLFDFFGKTTIGANGDFTNTGSEGMHFSYYVAFFDADKKLIGGTSFAQEGDYGVLGPGQNMRPASCRITIPDELRDKIASFKIAYYESKHVPKKK